MVITGHQSVQTDVAVDGGLISRVESSENLTGRIEINGEGLHLLPGVVDTQVHFREPGLTHKEDLESGSRAAICGGTTSVLEMPNTNPPTVSPQALADKICMAENRMWCDFGFFVGANAENADQTGFLESLPGTPGIKIFMGSSTGSLLVEEDDILLRILNSGIRPCSIHAEDEGRLKERRNLFFPELSVSSHNYLRDAESATTATKRIIDLSKVADRPVHILHISTGDEVREIQFAKDLGLEITAEVTPQHLWFTAPVCYETLGTLAQMNPPIREKYHNLSLWKGLNAGVFDVFGSDHAPHSMPEKGEPYQGGHGGSPSGMPGVQTMLQVLLRFVQEGRLSIETVVTMSSGAPAKLFGLKGKGQIAVGFDADLVLIDLASSQAFQRGDVQSKCGWSPFEGQVLASPPKAVFLRGQKVSENGKPIDEPRGQLLTYDWK